MFQRVLYCENASFLLTVVIVARREREKHKIIWSRSWFHLVSICLLLYMCMWYDLGVPIPRSQEFIQKCLSERFGERTYPTPAGTFESMFFSYPRGWICDTLSWSVLVGNTILCNFNMKMDDWKTSVLSFWVWAYSKKRWHPLDGDESFSNHSHPFSAAFTAAVKLQGPR